MSIEDIELIDDYIPSEELQKKISEEIDKLNLKKDEIKWVDDLSELLGFLEYELVYVLDKMPKYFKKITREGFGYRIGYMKIK